MEKIKDKDGNLTDVSFHSWRKEETRTETWQMCVFIHGEKKRQGRKLDRCEFLFMEKRRGKDGNLADAGFHPWRK